MVAARLRIPNSGTTLVRALSMFTHSKYKPQSSLKAKFELHQQFASTTGRHSHVGVLIQGRDICSEYDLYGTEPSPKVIRIGEAGKGHAFMSKAEGAILLTVKGKELPLVKIGAPLTLTSTALQNCTP